jgi:hypothetical protein
VSEGNKGEHNS